MEKNFSLLSNYFEYTLSCARLKGKVNFILLLSKTLIAAIFKFDVFIRV